MGTASRVALLVALGVALAGCQSGSDGEAEERPSFEDMNTELNILKAELFMEPLTEPAELPTEGSATYNGVMELEPKLYDAIPAMVGELEIEVGFDDDSLEGAVENLVTQGGQEMSGSLDIDDGRIFRDADVLEGEEYLLGATLQGRLEDEEGGTYDLSGGVAADFYGTDHQYIQGGTEGTVVGPDGLGTFAGRVFAER